MPPPTSGETAARARTRPAGRAPPCPQFPLPQAGQGPQGQGSAAGRPRSGEGLDAGGGPAVTGSAPDPTRTTAAPEAREDHLHADRGLTLQISEATRANVEDLGEEHGHRVLRVPGKSGKDVLVPLPPAEARAADPRTPPELHPGRLHGLRNVINCRDAAVVAAAIGVRRLPRPERHLRSVQDRRGLTVACQRRG